MAPGVAGETQPRERRESGHRPKKERKSSEHSTKDSNRHNKGRRSRQASQSEKHGDATSAPDHTDAVAKPVGKHLAKPHVAAAPRKESSSSPATSSGSSAKTTEVTDVKVAVKENSAKSAQPASG